MKSELMKYGRGGSASETKVLAFLDFVLAFVSAAEQIAKVNRGFAPLTVRVFNTVWLPYVWGGRLSAGLFLLRFTRHIGCFAARKTCTASCC